MKTKHGNYQGILNPTWVLITLLYFFSAQPMAQEKPATSNDVYYLAHSIDQKISAIGLAMGETLQTRKNFDVDEVSSRAVYFQARTFYKKTGRLMYDFTRTPTIEIEQIEVNAKPSHVFALLTLADKHLSEVASSLNIEIPTKGLIEYHTKKPKDVFLKIISMNQKINRLLDFRFSPADTFENITASIYQSSAILQTLPGVRTIEDPEALEKNISSEQVFQRLLRIHNELGAFLKDADSDPVVFTLSPAPSVEILPSDAYDMASVVFSRIIHIASILNLDDIHTPTYYPGKMVPSNVYQRASILEKQAQLIINIKSKLLK